VIRDSIYTDLVKRRGRREKEECILRVDLCYLGPAVVRYIMPKLIDNYVLSRKIGAGQYGEVFKGYDRATNNDIAVKSIRR
jgi:serine/threonine protein kinase